jgi:Holliday junction resolvase
VTPDPNPASAAGAAGSGDLDCLAAIGTSDSTPPKKKQRKSGGARPRQKGDRLERSLVRVLQSSGFGAERIPMSGACGGKYAGDISVPICNRDLTIEVKSRARGFAQIYAWLENRDALIVKSDRKDAIVVLRLRLASKIALAAERGKA